MKRIILAISAVMAFSSVAIAGGIPSGGTFTFKPSNNVGMTYFVDTNNQNYVANSKHTAGNRLFSSSNTTSNVWYKENSTYIGQVVADASGTETNPGESTYSGWSSQ